MARSTYNIEITADASQAIAEMKKVRRAASGFYVPDWCRSPWKRGFVLAHAFMAPILLIVLAVTR